MHFPVSVYATQLLQLEAQHWSQRISPSGEQHWSRQLVNGLAISSKWCGPAFGKNRFFLLSNCRASCLGNWIRSMIEMFEEKLRETLRIILETNDARCEKQYWWTQHSPIQGINDLLYCSPLLLKIRRGAESRIKHDLILTNVDASDTACRVVVLVVEIFLLIDIIN